MAAGGRFLRAVYPPARFRSAAHTGYSESGQAIAEFDQYLPLGPKVRGKKSKTFYLADVPAPGV
jgi:hypothetical protein